MGFQPLAGGDKIEIFNPDFIDKSGGDPRSYMIWANGRLGSGSFPRVFSQGSNGAGGYECVIRTSGGISYFDGSWNTAATLFPATGWHHVAWTFDGTNVVVYLDGIAINTDTYNTRSSSGDFVVAGKENSSSEGYQGKVAEPAYFSRGLTAAEVRFARLHGPKNIHGLEILWDLQRNYGNKALDISGHRRDGIISGGQWVEDPPFLVKRRQINDSYSRLIAFSPEPVITNPVSFGTVIG